MPNKKTLFNLQVAMRAALATRRAPSVPADGKPIDILFALVDHYEPQVHKPPRAKAVERVEDWLDRYPKIAGKHRDFHGHVPMHGFFYPWDEYDDWEMERIAELCAAGFGEIELHLHHENDTDATLRKKLRDALAAYRQHGGLSVWPDGRPAFAFIHGNWALDNSRIENGKNYCGVNNEITVLQEEGCYADFTFPAWQHLAQPRMLNCIYYAVDDPKRPKSHDTGELARAGVTNARGLPLIQGPLVPYLLKGKGTPRMAMDDADLAGYRRYHPDRLDRWVKAGIHVSGRPDRIFIKLHCHGADDRNRTTMLGEDLEAMFSDAESRYNDGKRYRLHYVTAREMFNIVKAMEAGQGDDLETARDFLLKPPSRK